MTTHPFVAFTISKRSRLPPRTYAIPACSPAARMSAGFSLVRILGTALVSTPARANSSTKSVWTRSATGTYSWFWYVSPKRQAPERIT